MTGYIGINNKAQNIKNVYFGLNNVARKIKKGYIGVNNVAQLWYSSGWTWDVYSVDAGYNPIEGVSDSATPNSAFYVGTSYTLDQNTGMFTVEQTTQIARSSTGATNAVGKYYISLSPLSGTQTGAAVYLITAASYSLLTLRLTITPITSQAYANRGSLMGSIEEDDITAYPINGIQDGYWYVMQFDYMLSYTGTYIDQCVYMSNRPYRLLTLTGSGTLSIEKALKADVWLCGGGATGNKSLSSSGTDTDQGSGGAGAYTQTISNTTIKDLIVQIGSADSNSSISGDLTLNAAGSTGVSGGSGGGGGGRRRAGGTGDGISKRPFNDVFFLYSFCDGGGGGVWRNSGDVCWGGDGGHDGSDGAASINNPTQNLGEHVGKGGHYGGDGGGFGWGTNYIPSTGRDATGYGSGGGGGGYAINSDYSSSGGGGSGYQGVCFIRIPLGGRRALFTNYVQLEYVQSTGAQYIDTGIVPDAYTKVECDFALTEVGSSNVAIFGVAGQFSFRKFNATTFRTNGSDNVNFTNILPDTNQHTVTKTATSTTLTAVGVSDETKTTSAGSCSLTLSIFAQHSGTSSYANNSSIKLYGFRIYDGNTLIKDFVPAKNLNDTVGLYDVLSDTFYVSGSETALVAGPVVNQ